MGFSKVRTSRIEMPEGGKIYVGDTELLDEIEALSGLDSTELGFLNGVTAGTATASKALVVDSNKDVGTIRNITISGNFVTGSTTLSEAELGVLDAVSAGTVAASKAVVVDANKDIGDFRNVTATGSVTAASQLTATDNGTANTGVTAEEHGDGVFHRTVLTVSQTDALTIADNAALSDGYLLYTLPAGDIAIHSAVMSMAVTAASTEAQSDTPDVGLGTTEGTGAVATLDAVGAAAENILTGQTASDSNGAATTAAVNTALFIASSDDHTIYFNVADTWANDTGGDLTADIAGYVVIEWSKLS